MLSSNDALSVINDIKNHIPNNSDYDESLTFFKNYVEMNSQECSKHSLLFLDANVETQREFLLSLENAINNNKLIIDNDLIKFFDRLCDINDQLSNSIVEVCRVVKIGLIKNQINKTSSVELWDLIKKLINFENICDTKHVSHDNLNSFTTSINSVNGLSFHILFEYLQWNNQFYNNNDFFNKNVKSIITKYIFGNNHTVSRHAVLGFYINLLRKYDDNLSSKITEIIFQNNKFRIAFWDSYILNNLLHDSVNNMTKMYDEFLNGDILNNLHDKRIYTKTLEHIVLGYLYSIESCVRIFDKFIINADPKSIKHVCYFVMNVLKQNSNTHKFEDNVEKLWKNNNIRKYGTSELWFDNIYDKSKSLDLLLDYLKNTDKKFTTDVSTLMSLEKYIDEYPETVLKCIKYLIEKNDGHILQDLSVFLKNKKFHSDSKLESLYNEITSMRKHNQTESNA